MIVEPLSGQAKMATKLATARWNIWEGAVRSAKTISSLLAWIWFVLHGPPGPLLMVGRTERTLKRNVIDTLVEMLGPKRCRHVAGSGELWLLGRRIYLVGANDEVAQEKIRGLTLAGAYVDEISTIPQSFWRMLSTRLSVDGSRLFGTSNPEGPRHWLKVNYLDRAKLTVRDCEISESTGTDTLDLHRFRFRLRDNPTLSPEYIASLDAEFTGLWRRRLIDGEWAIASGVIYDMFDPEKHVISELPAIKQHLTCGADHGATNPTAALMLAELRDGRLAFTREYRHDPMRSSTTLTVGQLSTQLMRWMGDERPRLGIAVDPAAKTLKDQLRADGFRYRDADNTVVEGIRLMSNLLATDRLVIHDSCDGLLDELPLYAWDDKAAERGEDKPMKANDHSCDAARYAISTSKYTWQQEPATIARKPAPGRGRQRVPGPGMRPGWG